MPSFIRHCARRALYTTSRLLPWLALGVLASGLWPLALPARPATIGVDEIEPGMHGYGLTVFRGTKPERFDVEVIDVMHDFRPDQDLILIRTPHPRLQQTQSVAGMSGSPIYLDGRLAGAYAYGWGFGTEPIAGVTPIANMLEELRRPMRPATAPLAQLLPTPSSRAAPHAEAAFADADALAPLRRYAKTARRASSRPGARKLTTPLLVSGMTPQVADLLGAHLEPLGLEVLQAGGGNGRPRGATTDVRYEDGGALAVQLVRGDIQATAVGTITHVVGERLLAFGHPMLDGGQVALPTATARVLHLLASRRTSFKIAEALTPKGTLVQDRQAAVVVDSGTDPDAIPVRLRLHGVPGLPRNEWKAEIARHDLLTAPLLLSLASSALGASLSDGAPMAIEVRSSVWLKDRGPYRGVDAIYTEQGAASPGYLTQLSAFRVLNTALHNPFERVQAERVELDFHIDFGRKATEIVSASLPTGALDPGSTVPLTLTLRHLDAREEQRVVQLAIPASLAGEELEVEVEPGSQVKPVAPRPRDLQERLENVLRGYPDRSLVVSVRRSGAHGAQLEGHVLQNLPASAMYALVGENDSGRATPFAAERHLVIPMDTVMYGSASLKVEVRKEPRWADREED